MTPSGTPAVLAEATPGRAPPPPAARQILPAAVALAFGGAGGVTVALEPEALGRVEVRIERAGGDAAAAVRVLAERPETLALLQRDAPMLDRALTQAGVTLAEGGLQFGLSRGGEGGQQQGGGGRGPSRTPTVAPARDGPTRAASLALLDIAV